MIRTHLYGVLSRRYTSCSTLNLRQPFKMPACLKHLARYLQEIFGLLSALFCVLSFPVVKCQVIFQCRFSIPLRLPLKKPFIYLSLSLSLIQEIRQKYQVKLYCCICRYICVFEDSAVLGYDPHPRGMSSQHSSWATKHLKMKGSVVSNPG